MNGIKLSESFFNEIVYPYLNNNYIFLLKYISVALLGEGSEVLGYDDNISKDHNYSARLILFIEDSKYTKFGNELEQNIIKNCPDSFMDIEILKKGYCKSISVVPLKSFFLDYLNIKNNSIKKTDWIKLDEQKLVEITAGKIFFDSGNQLKKIREFYSFYPDEIKWFLVYQGFQRLSESDGIIRAVKRKDHISSNLYIGSFIYFAIKIFHTINDEYCPYTKWMGENLKKIGSDNYGLELNKLITELSSNNDLNQTIPLVKKIMTFLTDCICKITGEKINEYWVETNLELLNYNYDEMSKILTKRISKELFKLDSCVSPITYWGKIFSFDGFGCSYEELLRKNLSLFE